MSTRLSCLMNSVTRWLPDFSGMNSTCYFSALFMAIPARRSTKHPSAAQGLWFISFGHTVDQLTANYFLLPRLQAFIRRLLSARYEVYESRYRHAATIGGAQSAPFWVSSALYI